ncbi:hypothetical protein K474DRAFT_1710450 [Panus rudis PR-1116 ss-1]|nr:hypothetical protein K474DRAFT_1710450 [Panus rudis PR-1116 ss-1]
MVNSTGRNGHNNGHIPPEDQLVAALHKYAVEGIPQKARLQRLSKELGYHIRLTKLGELNKKYNVPSVRKPPPAPVARTLINGAMAADTSRLNGPNSIRQTIAMQGYRIPRDTVRKVMHEEDPLGFDLRQPGTKRVINRKPLTSIGILHEVSCDGHEKFSKKALDMGEVGIDVYGMRDKCSGKALSMRAVPNARKEAVVVHLYLDLAEEVGAIPMQLTIDKGSETGLMCDVHATLRNRYAPHLDIDQWPPYMAMTSTRNIRIENMWSRLRKYTGINIADVLKEGKTNQYFNPNNPVHVNLFQWLWPPIVQEKLDEFAMYWNTHHVRKQDESNLPSGAPPNHIFEMHDVYGFPSVHIPVPQEAIAEMREQLPLTREDAFRWVSDDFADHAQSIYEELGSPLRAIHSGWEIFAMMAPRLQEMYL